MNLEGPETNCCSAKVHQYSRIVFSDLSKLGRGKQTGFQNQDTDQCRFSVLFMIFRGRERNCLQDLCYTHCSMRLLAEVEEPPQVKKRWALLPLHPPHSQLKKLQDGSRVFSWQLNTCFILNKDTHENIKKTEMIWNYLWYITKQFIFLNCHDENHFYIKYIQGI